MKKETKRHYTRTTTKCGCCGKTLTPVELDAYTPGNDTVICLCKYCRGED